MKQPGQKCREDQHLFDEECMESKKKDRGRLWQILKKKSSCKQNKVPKKQKEIWKNCGE
jgi:hypothetical protein